MYFLKIAAPCTGYTRLCPCDEYFSITCPVVSQIREDLSQHEIDVFPWELAEDDAVEETAKSKMKVVLIRHHIM